MNKKRVAMEWLSFLSCILFGLIGMPVFWFLLGSALEKLKGSSISFYFSFSEFASQFYSALAGLGHAPVAGDTLRVWLSVLAPYFIFQLVRSVFWAWKTVRGDDDP